MNVARNYPKDRAGSYLEEASSVSSLLLDDGRTVNHLKVTAEPAANVTSLSPMWTAAVAMGNCYFAGAGRAAFRDNLDKRLRNAGLSTTGCRAGDNNKFRLAPHICGKKLRSGQPVVWITASHRRIFNPFFPVSYDAL
jgi:hypothetical protein